MTLVHSWLVFQNSFYILNIDGFPALRVFAKVIEDHKGKSQNVTILGHFQLIFGHISFLQIVEMDEHIRLVLIFHYFNNLPRNP